MAAGSTDYEVNIRTNETGSDKLDALSKRLDAAKAKTQSLEQAQARKAKALGTAKVAAEQTAGAVGGLTGTIGSAISAGGPLAAIGVVIYGIVQAFIAWGESLKKAAARAEQTLDVTKRLTEQDKALAAAADAAAESGRRHSEAMDSIAEAADKASEALAREIEIAKRTAEAQAQLALAQVERDEQAGKINSEEAIRRRSRIEGDLADARGGLDKDAARRQLEIEEQRQAELKKQAQELLERMRALEQQKPQASDNARQEFRIATAESREAETRINEGFFASIIPGESLRASDEEREEADRKLLDAAKRVADEKEAARQALEAQKKALEAERDTILREAEASRERAAAAKQRVADFGSGGAESTIRDIEREAAAVVTQTAVDKARADEAKAKAAASAPPAAAPAGDPNDLGSVDQFLSGGRPGGDGAFEVGPTIQRIGQSLNQAAGAARSGGATNRELQQLLALAEDMKNALIESSQYTDQNAARLEAIAAEVAQIRSQNHNRR